MTWPIFCAPLPLTQFTSTFQIVSTKRRTPAKPCIVLLLDVLTRQVPWLGDLDLYFALQWLWHILRRRSISSTIRPTAVKPCKVLLLKVLTLQIPWPGDLDLYFGCIDFDIIYFNVPDLLKCKTSSHQTLHSASPRCTDSAGILTRLPWPIFCAPVPFTHFTSTFNISYNHQTLHSASPQCTDSAGTLTGWPWPIFRAPLTFTPFTSPFHMSSAVRPSSTKSYVVLLDILTRQVPWPGDLDQYFALQRLWHILHWCLVSPKI